MDEVKKVIANALFPWNEEHLGEKFAIMDAHSMADEVLEALGMNGFIICKRIDGN